MKKKLIAAQITLEQYPTNPHLTASVVLTALQKEDLGPGRRVLDLGCGTGMLALGCALMDCDIIIGVECDEEALQMARQNAEEMELDDKIMFLLAKVKDLSGTGNSTSSRRAHQQAPARGGRGKQRRDGGRRHTGGGRGGGNNVRNKCMTPEAMELIMADDDGVPLRSNCVDTVLTNPPFGTKHNAGMDIRFLRTATRLASRAVYSFHKTSTRNFLVKKVQEWDMEVEIVAQMKFELPKTYKFHKEKSVDIEVDLVRVITGKESNNL